MSVDFKDKNVFVVLHVYMQLSKLLCVTSHNRCVLWGWCVFFLQTIIPAYMKCVTPKGPLGSRISCMLVCTCASGVHVPEITGHCVCISVSHWHHRETIQIWNISGRTSVSVKTPHRVLSSGKTTWFKWRGLCSANSRMYDNISVECRLIKWYLSKSMVFYNEFI